MVWGLFPVESLPGEQKYFIFSKGTYRVGRKGCDVIINTDKGVSRVHAEVVVNSMISMDTRQRRSTNSSSGVCIKDCSKYGTFINKTLGSKTKVHEFPDKEAPVKDGDLISFGTGNATYRLCFIPVVFFVCCLKPYHMDRPLQEEISSIGARASHSWSAECTHVLVDESMPAKSDLFDAIVAQKPVILRSWVKAVAERSISTELPSYAAYIPTLMLEGFAVKIVDPKAREDCLAGHTFLLGVLDLYKFDKMRSLLNVGGAKVLSVDEFGENSLASEEGAGNRVVLVIPAVSGNVFNHLQHLRSLPRVNEMNLVSAVLSGHLDPSAVESASIIVSSSCSTDETIVADSDVEADEVASDQITASASLQDTGIHEFKEKLSGHNINTTKENIEIPSFKAELSGHKVNSTENIEIPSFRAEDRGVIERNVKSDYPDTSENQNSDVLFSQDLIVRDTNLLISAHSTTITGAINFKCFKKRDAQSGNSFRNLIPFAKDPYQESDIGSEVAKQVREEKKRKQSEAVAEDLFNNDKPRRRGAAGSSLHALLTRG